MENKEILQLMGKISPQGRDYVSTQMEQGNIEVIYSISTEENTGVFLKTDNDDYCIFYASFTSEAHMEEILAIIKDKTSKYLSENHLSENKSKKFCFNVYGQNEAIIKLVRELGFKSDMEGFHMEYIGEGLPVVNGFNLTEKGYEEGKLEEFVEVFDGAYEQLCKDNGWPTDGYASNKEGFHKSLTELDREGQIRSFWRNEELVGAYVIKGNYIVDLVIKPKYQNEGYGSYLIAHCMKAIRDKGMESTRLRVAKTNYGAKRLYERLDFGVIGWFAEHTYRN